jgi:hypothetical protein
MCPFNATIRIAKIEEKEYPVFKNTYKRRAAVHVPFIKREASKKGGYL